MYYRFLYLGFKVYCFIFRPIRMGVRIMMIKDGKVWLVRHTYLSGWYMPGGGVKRLEPMDVAARREAREETGAELGEVELVGIYTGNILWKTDHTTVFICKDFKFTGKSDAEIAEMRAFPLDELPEDTYGLHRHLLERFHGGEALPKFGKWEAQQKTKWV